MEVRLATMQTITNLDPGDKVTMEGIFNKALDEWEWVEGSATQQYEQGVVRFAIGQAIREAVSICSIVVAGTTRGAGPLYRKK